MANPQKEKGYTGIANEIMEVLARIPGITNSMNRVITAVFRKTYGWKKKSDKLSISQLQEITGLKRRTIIYSVQQLEAMKILVVLRTKVGQYNQPNEISFNKDYESWKITNCAPQVERNRKNNLKIYLKKGSAKVKKMEKTASKGSAKARLKVVQKSVKDSAKSLHPQKKQKKQKKIQKKAIKKYKYFLNGKQIGELIETFKGVNPMYKDFFMRNGERQACDGLAKQIGFDKILSVIKQLPVLTALPFAPKITSPLQLRRDLGKMIVFYNQEMSKRSSHKKEDRDFII